MEKLNNLIKSIKEANLDALLISSEYSRYWLSELNSTAGWILCTNCGERILIIDGRYYFGLKANFPKNITKIVLATDYYTELKDLLNKEQIKNLGFESEYLTYQSYINLKSKIEIKNLNLVPFKTIQLRMIKSEHEIEKLKKAANIITNIHQELEAFIKPGLTETDVANHIVFLSQKYNADGLSFPSIVAWTKNAANPHYHPSSNQKIKENGIVLVDMGVYYQGFASDMTRVFFVGDKTKIDQKIFEIYQIVKEAQQIGVDLVKPGVRTSEIHKQVFNHIESKGYGKYFIHRTGHGLGIEVHELPNVADYDNTILKPGMVVTIEPGIYLPEVGGIRIEDDVLVGPNGPIVLTKNATKEINFIKN
ncbi:M24 family metallopeptidase [Mycoplasma sp. SG1]|uniref:M24 family metallopeptidase n=1 Tax=Mycoplasma sp. SG1 TaxID=2810348 RepID=UPI0020250A55|nr:Xaa-Pro peptidase family protein [Mycoplasma sp. SG1]URM53118.1 Xaa-Pro peptidase family protein [Mycoplasma sp. SG1]